MKDKILGVIAVIVGLILIYYGWMFVKATSPAIKWIALTIGVILILVGIWRLYTSCSKPSKPKT